ncbi:hypothetical protein C3K47_09870 [Solitalea longa]|uniref:Uncharacterized protein n=1 Tax=Solitalea longa TaxID=2079460 RepID=A0A2S5A2Z5_9SPHI|nr:hypothetical protein [Solitalea longa]POY36667.1 hypothetical protein C3K47_09870 [Solitalea longa]
MAIGLKQVILIGLAVLVGLSLLLLIMGFPGNLVFGMWGITLVFLTIFLILYGITYLFSRVKNKKAKKPAKKPALATVKARR